MQERTRILVIDNTERKIREHFLLPNDLVDEFMQIAIILTNGDHALARKLERRGLDVLGELQTGDLLIGRRALRNQVRGFENTILDLGSGICEGNGIIIGGYDDEEERIISSYLEPSEVKVNFYSEEMIDFHTRCLN